MILGAQREVKTDEYAAQGARAARDAASVVEEADAADSYTELKDVFYATGV
jgi:hypothetical protein